MVHNQKIVDPHHRPGVIVCSKYGKYKEKQDLITYNARALVKILAEKVFKSTILLIEVYHVYN